MFTTFTLAEIIKYLALFTVLVTFLKCTQYTYGAAKSDLQISITVRDVHFDVFFIADQEESHSGKNFDIDTTLCSRVVKFITSSL